MTRDQIIRMAREAGFEQLAPDIEDWVCFTEEIERFAALVAAAEREACFQIVESEAMAYSEPVWAVEIVNDIRARGEK